MANESLNQSEPLKAEAEKAFIALQASWEIEASQRSRPVLRLIDCAKQRREVQQKETVEIVNAIMRLAVIGEIVGVALTFRKADGYENFVLTGPYKANPGEAVNAAARMSLEMTQMQLDATGPFE